MYKHFQDVFADSPEAYTYSASYPSERIDYIFTSGDISIEQKEVINTLASDHLPIVAAIVLERTQPNKNGLK